MRWMAAALMALAAAVAAMAMALSDGPPERADALPSSAGPLAVRRVAGPFEHPWGLAFLPDGAMLVTERQGRLWRVGADGAKTEVAGLPPVEEDGQGGLLDVLAARDFAATREIFLTYAAPDPAGSRTTLAAARLAAAGDRLEDLRVLFEQTPPVRSGRHFGSRVVEGSDGTLFVTVGDRGDPPNAQDPARSIGKVLRVARDGSVPADNPFAGTPGTRPEIWSLGHRNPQGMALDAEGRLWTVEHGARGGDEINRPEAGRNYGWPRISYGTHYSGAAFPGSAAPGLEQPVYYWDPSIAPSGMVVYSGRLWPEWAGDIFVGALKFRLLARLDREGDRITGEERLFKELFGRIRDVREGPDGALWFLTDEDDGGLYRVTPAR
ncbi:PQQ-dependent sugar dehydrogenase [Paralimibaculum aggregatum]|uniref:PQQ-dependent sugar dehydrogenase n=1 Tax=Paralimibaculum aggregatum TaxID=3036245 RepID=A0ABQ6LJ92_9RHOB|nr:PQQ-dependent sugar dehydrogenase [Limibaculum sp. NKW23]GMG81268.1 PQQ-dependent sugar dehydrogenase [Limibaculum sp. NKW23]